MDGLDEDDSLPTLLKGTSRNEEPLVPYTPLHDTPPIPPSTPNPDPRQPSPSRSPALNVSSNDLDSKIALAVRKRMIKPQSSMAGLRLPIHLGDIPVEPKSLKDTYIKLHAGKLILDKNIFSHLSPEQLAELGKLETKEALAILHNEAKDVLKKKYRKAGKGRGDTASISRKVGSDPIHVTPPSSEGISTPAAPRSPPASLPLKHPPAPAVTAHSTVHISSLHFNC